MITVFNQPFGTNGQLLAGTAPALAPAPLSGQIWQNIATLATLSAYDNVLYIDYVEGQPLGGAIISAPPEPGVGPLAFTMSFSLSLEVSNSATGDLLSVTYVVGGLNVTFSIVHGGSGYYYSPEDYDANNFQFIPGNTYLITIVVSDGAQSLSANGVIVTALDNFSSTEGLSSIKIVLGNESYIAGGFTVEAEAPTYDTHITAPMGTVLSSGTVPGEYVGVFFDEAFATEGLLAGTFPGVNTAPLLVGGTWYDINANVLTVSSGQARPLAITDPSVMSYARFTGGGPGYGEIAFAAQIEFTPSTINPVYGLEVVFFVGGATVGFRFECNASGVWTVFDELTYTPITMPVTSGVSCLVDIVVGGGNQRLTVGGVHAYKDKTFTNQDGLSTIDLKIGGNGSVSRLVLARQLIDLQASLTGSHGGILLTAPSPTLLAYGNTGARLSAPAPAVQFYGGANSRLSPPAPILQALGGASAFITAPSPTLSAQGHNATGENDFTYTAPSPTLTAYGGANAHLTAPKPKLEVTATGTNWGQANLRAPSPLLVATGAVSGTGRFAQSAPMATLIGYSGAVCSITLTGKATVTASGTTGSVGKAALTAPLFKLTASGHTENYGSANLIAPSPRLGATAQAYLIAPRGRLTAIGSAVVVVAYEAYAANLKHNNPEAPNEVTRYTNFPFDRIVRYKNSYFGMNSTGLYLLEGTTDDGAAIPFAIETGKTDFGKVEQKTLVSAYFGGRIGSEQTVTLLAGETTPIAYNYTTPRSIQAQNHRQKFGRGVKSRYYALGVSGSQEFELDTIDIELDILTRSI